ncbi:hypothetical protein SBI_08300 [Streptomyces bingchenggensis BCW-1]|uniref:Uncharacterized protein n=1 Tax=Streptomyces bingchenggensis (strain BCW-1) TaxID=749414 RepID=D7BR68_STRBB|nr:MULTISPECIES: DUF2207 domain-containing protein [Streptomyces]ADI11418.1 hypothetical protein SBI_08300 [Streptomyces bingchenggensis BCW-1]
MSLALFLLGMAVVLGGEGPSSGRVTKMWISAEIAEDGSARITEVIDYDFAWSESSGIYVDLPGLFLDQEAARISTTEDGAPVRPKLTTDGWRTRIHLGDPDDIGIHRYRIRYTLKDVVHDGKLDWIAIGNAWKIDRDNVEIHVVAPYDLTGTRCVQNAAPSFRKSCTAEEPEPGHLVVTLDRLEAGRGVALYASGTQAGPASEAAAPAPPSGAADGDELVNSALTGLLAMGVALCSALLVVRLLRHVGRDRLATDEPGPAVLTPTTSPPEGLSPAQGGPLVTGRVGIWHQAAWLLSAAIAGHIVLEAGEEYTTVRRGTAGDTPADPVTETVLDAMFAGREEFILGVHDWNFGRGWRVLGEQLADWQRTSGLWDPAGEHRSRTARRIGIATAPLGLAIATLGSVLNAHMNSAGWPVVVAGAVAAGTGLALWLRGWELRTRTARGKALWLQAESFRRFLADWEPPSTDEQSDDGQWPPYPLWALALVIVPPHRWTAMHRHGPVAAVGVLAPMVVPGPSTAAS